MTIMSSGWALLLSPSTVKKRFSRVCERVDGQHSWYWSSGFFLNLACRHEKVDCNFVEFPQSAFKYLAKPVLSGHLAFVLYCIKID